MNIQEAESGTSGLYHLWVFFLITVCILAVLDTVFKLNTDDYPTFYILFFMIIVLLNYFILRLLYNNLIISYRIAWQDFDEDENNSHFKNIASIVSIQ